MAYFYYQKNPFGRWAPCKTEDQPTTRTADGAKRKITRVTEIPPMFEGFSLTDLAAFYPPTEP